MIRENERLLLLCNHFDELVPRLESRRAERVKIQSNGHTRPIAKGKRNVCAFSVIYTLSCDEMPVEAIGIALYDWVDKNVVGDLTLERLKLIRFDEEGEGPLNGAFSHTLTTMPNRSSISSI